MRAWQWIGSILIAALVARGACAQRVLTVPGQYPTINAAIGAAWDNDTIRVAPGTYRESVRLNKNVTLESVAGPFRTTIDAQGGIGVLFDRGVRTAVVDGFTITNATLSGVSAIGALGGTVRNNRIVGNGNVFGGGGIDAADSRLRIVDNHIEGNTAGHGGGILAGYTTGYPVILRNTIVGNVASVDGGGILASSALSGALIAQNVVRGNVAGRDGGGVYFEVRGADFDSNVIVGNRSARYGGGIYHAVRGYPATPLTHGTVAFNTADVAGGGAAVANDGIYEDSIYWGNASPIGPEIAKIGAGRLLLRHGVVARGALSIATVSPTSLTTVTWGPGMRVTDPRFVDPSVLDVHLQATSPMIDRGSRFGLARDADGDLRGRQRDVGADEFAPRLYIVGEPRPAKAFTLRVVGSPGPVVLGISATAGRRPIPLALPGVTGALLLADPIRVIPIGRLPATGVLSLPVVVPPAFPAPTPFVAQALLGSVLTAPVDVWIH